VIARQILQTKLDDFVNGSESVSAQKKRLLAAKTSYQEKKAAKLRDLKKEFKQREDSEQSEGKSSLGEDDIHVEGNN